MALQREMNLTGLVFYGTGTILGAGIFVVIGEVLGKAGPATPLAYALAGLVAVFTALSFAEIGARIPTAAGAIDYLEGAFGDRFHLPAIVGWLLIVANVVSGATITTGFVSYLQSFVPISNWLATIGLILVVGFISIAGMKQAAWFMSLTTFVGLATLLTILWLTRDGLFAWPGMLVDGGMLGQGGSGTFAMVFAGAFLALYSFIGFGDMAQTAEELKRPKRNLPRGIVITIILVFSFYLLIAMALSGLDDIAGIANADAPLVHAATRANDFPALPLALASLLVIINGSLTQIVAASRLLMDLGRDERGGVPRQLGKVNERTNTPVRATLIVLAIALALALFIPLGTLAAGTSFAILLVFALVNLALWRLKRQSQPDDAPNLWIGIPVIGFALCALTIIGQLIFALPGMSPA